MKGWTVLIYADFLNSEEFYAQTDQLEEVCGGDNLNVVVQTDGWGEQNTDGIRPAKLCGSTDPNPRAPRASP